MTEQKQKIEHERRKTEMEHNGNIINNYFITKCGRKLKGT